MAPLREEAGGRVEGSAVRERTVRLEAGKWTAVFVDLSGLAGRAGADVDLVFQFHGATRIRCDDAEHRSAPMRGAIMATTDPLNAG